MIVFDTGALIALERRKQRAVQIWTMARRDQMEIFVPGAVIAEWWRSRPRGREAHQAGVTIEPVEGRLGRAAGEAIAATGASVVDAIVMAVAARLGATVFTSDVDDLENLRAFFPGVRVLTV
jgi:predicted nucleic acid-binding protein